jgi:hypothetical protein
MQRTLVLIVCSTVVLTLRSTCHAVDFAWWVDWSMRPSGTEVEGVPVSALNPNWRHASVIRESDLPAASRQPGERPEDNGAVFSVDIDLDGDRHDEKAVVGVYETAQGKIGRFLLILGRASSVGGWTKKALFSVNDPNPFSAIRMVQGTLHWVGCFECDDDCTVIRSKSGLFQLHC